LGLDSRKQAVADVSFGGTNSNVAVSGFGYVTYRVQVPVQQIAWQVKVTPVSGGDPSVAVRRDKVPNEFNNDAFSEVPGAVADSVTLVPPTLSDGTFYITVYGSSPYTFTLQNSQPVITPISYTSTVTNDDVNRAGWRYFVLTNIAEQLGSLGWDLFLSNHVTGTEIALRRNAVPGRWNYRNTDNDYYTNSLHYVDYPVDYPATGGFLQHPGHQADIWYAGVYTPNTNLGAFVLRTQPLTAALTNFDESLVSVINQPAGKWRFLRIDVPTNALGWDVRVVNVTAGNPQMVVNRDALPEFFCNCLDNPVVQWTPSSSAHWLSGYKWTGGVDWTGRPNGS